MLTENRDRLSAVAIRHPGVTDKTTDRFIILDKSGYDNIRAFRTIEE